MASEPNEQNNLLDVIKVIYEAIKPLDEDSRRRVIASALAALGSNVGVPSSQQISSSASEVRPPSPIELLEQKKPSNNPERIALFAYFRERVERKPRFSRNDLKDYFAKFNLLPAQNYDRDFNRALELGYIYEDDADSYLTTRGLEAIESEFANKAQQKPKAASKKSRPSKRSNKK